MLDKRRITSSAYGVGEGTHSPSLTDTYRLINKHFSMRLAKILFLVWTVPKTKNKKQLFYKHLALASDEPN